MALTSGVLLDSHTWLWLQNDELDRPAHIEKLLQQAITEDLLFASSISMLEIANAVLRGRVHLQMELATWLEITLQKPGVRLLDITPPIALETMKLPEAFHGDPGDRLIAATARVEQLNLLTHDRNLLRFGRQGVIRTTEIRKKAAHHAR